MWGPLVAHCERQELEEVAVKIFSGEGPKQRWGLRSNCCTSLLPPCHQRHHSCRQTLLSLHIPASHQLLNNICSNRRKEQILILLLVYFLVCYYFHF